MTITFKEARYIKLGKGGCWNNISIDRGEIHFGFADTSHALALSGDFEAIRGAQLKVRRSTGAATSDARTIQDFYSLGRDCLWITFARGHLWWTFSDPEVSWLGDDGLGRDSPVHGQRFRKCNGWSNLDINGKPLTLQSLSTSLTKVAAYQGTICRVQESEGYLHRRINALVDPLILEAHAANAKMLDVLGRAIARLHQTDFETLADVIFARSGWNRISALGGTQEFIDLALEQPATGERAAAQVKSQANQSVLDDYIAQFDAAGTFSKLFFICHTASTSLTAPDRNDVYIWHGQELSQVVLRLGLAEWTFTKSE